MDTHLLRSIVAQTLLCVSHSLPLQQLVGWESVQEKPVYKLMVAKPIEVLVVEDNLEYAAMLQMILGEVQPRRCVPTYVGRLGEALHSMTQNKYDIVLLDLSLPDSDGLDTLNRVHADAPNVPIVVITGDDDRRLAVQVVRNGAQDFLVASELKSGSLYRSLICAIERHRTIDELQRQTLIDELTGLFNRRGFISLADKQLKIARRARWEALLLYADLDGLKRINDRFGHSMGDKMLIAAAKVLRNTFRASDVVARIGGDEFTVLAVKAPDSSVQSMTGRLKANISEHNRQKLANPLSLSFGVTLLDPQEQITLDEAIARADRALYQHKNNKTGG